MDDERPPDDGPEAVFAAWLARREAGEGEELDALLSRRPELADELRRLHADWERVAGVLDRLAAGGSAVVSRHLDDTSRTALTPPPSGEVIERLTSRARSFDRYELRGEIARGGMGAILRVWDEDLRRHLAMKVVLGKASAADAKGDTPHVDPKTLGRFLEEAQVTGQLDHPGIVPVHELGLDDDQRAYFTMKLVRGRNLAELLEAHREGDPGWGLQSVLRVFLRVCEAMAYAHSKDVVHRDLKPANVMVGRFGETYVMDWGLARVVGKPDPHDLRIAEEPPQTELLLTDRAEAKHGETPDSPLVTHDGDIIGTPAYMSPEQAMGLLEELGPRSDVYSIGAMLYQLLTGRMPYAPERGKASPRTLLGMLLSGPPAPVRTFAPDAPDELVAICEKAMSREPGARYADALELRSDLEAYLNLRPVAAHAPGRMHELALFARRNRSAVTTAAAALLVLLVSTVWYVVGLNEAIASEQRANDEIQQRADLSETTALLHEYDELWPAVPGRVAGFRGWLDRADAILSRLGAYRAHRDAPGDAAIHLGSDELDALLSGLERLSSRRPAIAARLDFAGTLAATTIDAHAETWARVAADVRADERFDGLELAPQLGLVPLRRDPGSRLWEFWHVASGERPVAAPGHGYSLEPETAIVLVLTPPSTYESYRDGEQRHAALFLSKYELTQGQYVRAMEANPSKYRAETSSWGGDLHPVESLSWLDATEVARRYALSLPGGWSWEGAARAGSEHLYHWSASYEDLEGKENVRDASAEREDANGMLSAGWDDGYAVHAPVGSFAPNAYGLHDMLGNVSEWCADGPPASAAKGSTGVGLDRSDGEIRSTRGGSWYVPYNFCWVGWSQPAQFRTLNHNIGVRLSRAIDRGGAGR